MSTDPTPDPRRHDAGMDPSPDQTGPGEVDERSGATEHPDRHLARDDADDMVTHPLNPPPERRSQRRAQRDERPGS